MTERTRKWTISHRQWWIIACIFGFFRTVSLYFYNNEAPLLSTVPYVFLCLFRFMFYSLLFFSVIIAARQLLLRYGFALFCPVSALNPRTGWLDYGTVFLGWLPNVIIKYPGAMCWDTWDMLFCYRTGYALNARQSAFYSLLLGYSMTFFERLEHADWGLWLLILGQYLLYVLAFGYSLQLTRRMGFRRGVRWAVTGYYLLCPYVIAYLGVAIKDAPYSALMMLLTMLLLDCSLDAEAFCSSKAKLILLVLSSAGICLIRKNGICVIGLTALFSCIISLRQCQGKARYRLPAAMLCGCVLCLVINGALSRQHEILPGSIKDALSLPFQQTARYVKYHSDDVTEEERSVIDSILQYDTLADRYDPRISDPVKNRYTENDALLPAYFSVWARQFIRHPLCYCAAAWEQNYYLFVPEAERSNIVLYQDDDVGYELDEPVVISESTVMYAPVFRQPPSLSRWKTWVIAEYRLLHNSLLVGTLSNVSVNTYLFLATLFFMLFRKRACLLPFIPALLTLLTVLAGPAIQGHPRYLFPVIYSTPLLLSFALFTWHEQHDIR